MGYYTSEALLEARLFQHGIRSVAGFDLGIDGEVARRNRAIPNLMIASALAVKPAARLAQYAFELGGEISHQAV